MTYDEKKQFIDVIYSLVDEFDEVEDLFSASNLYLILRKYSSLNEENKQKVSSVMESLASTVKGNIREYLHGKESSIKGRLGGIRDIFSRE